MISICDEQTISMWSLYFRDGHSENYYKLVRNNLNFPEMMHVHDE